MRHIRHLTHVLVVALSAHVVHVVTSERFKDAYVDVGLDHGLQLVEHVSHIMGDH